jgi:hypothetical protein
MILLSVIFCFGFGGKPKALEPILIDNFEDGDILQAPNWWKFDNVKFAVKDATAFKIKPLGKYVLQVGGKANGWYVGGFGAYLAQPVDKYSHLQLDVYGSGKESGTLKIELYEDDNGNKQIEQDIAHNYIPTKDDKWQYELKIDWKGWKQIAIPFTEFTLANAGVGNGVWDPDDKNGSGGLVNVQFIVVGATETSDVNFSLDNIKIVKIEEIQPKK